MSAAISHAAIASTRGDALCLGAACIVVRIASFMLIFPYNRSDPLAYVFEHSLTGPLIALTRSEEHTSELQSLMRISYAVFCLKKKKKYIRKNKKNINKVQNHKHITTYDHNCYYKLTNKNNQNH